MHPLTKTYLNRIETRLKKLTPDEREQQIEEIALHLQALIVDNQAQGMSESDATQAALLQFGTPAKIGRGIEEQVIVGHKTSLAKGILVGAIGGIGLLVLFWLLLCLSDLSFNPLAFGLGNIIEELIEAAFAGALSSLVGRRFTWRCLSRPSRPWPLFSEFSQIGTVSFRTMGVGVLCGVVDGAVFGFANTTLALLDPRCTVTSGKEMIVILAVSTLAYAVNVSLLAGFLGVVLGALRWAFGRKPTRQRA